MRPHDLMSPSSIERIIACPPSFDICKSIEEKASSYADEGTLAHDLCELLILRHLRRIHEKPFLERLKKIKAVTDPSGKPYYNKVMHGHCEKFAAFVISKFHSLKKSNPEAQIFLEIKVTIDQGIRKSFGYLDVIIISNYFCYIIDFKYGAGVLVEAEDNGQLRMYALGVMNTFEDIFPFFAFNMIIYQPRMDNISYFVQDDKQLLEWADVEMKPAIALAIKGNGEMKAGAHCKFCKARPNCRVNANYQLELEKHNSCPPELIEEKEIKNIVRRASELSSWCESIKEWALSQALKGKKIPGMKLVRGRGQRYFTDKEKVRRVLNKAGFKDENILNTDLKNLTELEEIVGPSDFNHYLNLLIKKYFFQIQYNWS